LFSHCPPIHLRKSGSSSRTLCSPTEYFLPSARLKPEDFKLLPWSCGPSSRHQPPAGLFRAILIAQNLSAFDVSHVRDGFLRGWPCRFVSPYCHVQGSLFRGLLFVRSRIAFQQPLPSRRCPSSATSSCPLAPLRQASPSGLYSASESVTQLPGVSQ